MSCASGGSCCGPVINDFPAMGVMLWESRCFAMSSRGTALEHLGQITRCKTKEKKDLLLSLHTRARLLSPAGVRSSLARSIPWSFLPISPAFKECTGFHDQQVSAGRATRFASMLHCNNQSAIICLKDAILFVAHNFKGRPAFIGLVAFPLAPTGGTLQYDELPAPVAHLWVLFHHRLIFPSLY